MQATERYILGNQIGEGGFGTVHEAIDQVTSSVVAVKQLRRLSLDSVSRFKREFRVLAELTHRNLVAYHQLMQRDRDWLLVMDYVKGQSVNDYIRFGLTSSDSHIANIPTSVMPEYDSDESSLEINEGLSTEERSRSAVDNVFTTPGVQTDADVDRSSVRFRSSKASNNGPAPLRDPVQYQRLREVLRQMVRGLRFLHHHHLIHRDIKPQNVLVDEQGRVVILDFGLVYHESGLHNRDARAAHGTPAYMAPELIRGSTSSSAVDWYALGVLLYEVVTGRLPYRIERNAKYLQRTGKLIDVRSFSPDLPDDIYHIINALLLDNPMKRLDGEAIVHLLDDNSGLGSAYLPQFSEQFVGRHQELSAMRLAWSRVCELGQGEAILVQGPSGMGKSSLVRRFVEECNFDPGTLVLNGACYQHERLPFKLLDQIIEGIVEYLMDMPREQRNALLPAEIGWVARLFPVFGRLGGRLVAEINEEVEIRRRAFQALRQVIQSIARQTSLIVVLDNIHWGDYDSLNALETIVTTPGAPPMLLLATARDDEGHKLSNTFQEIMLRQQVACELLHLQPLSDGDITVMVSDIGVDADVTEVIDQAQGHPLLLHRLLSRPDLLRQRLSLQELICAQLRELSRDESLLLQAVCVAGQVRSLAFYQRLLADDQIADWGKTQQHLLTSGMLRLVSSSAGSSGSSGGFAVQDQQRLLPYHDKISETCLADMDESSAINWHRRFTQALAEHPNDEAEALGRHWHALGERARATRHYNEAATQAERQLAFARAADILKILIILDDTPGARPSLYLRRGNALVNAGQGLKAAECFAAATNELQGTDARNARLQAASQLLRAGAIDRGMIVAKKVCDELHIPWRASGARLIWALIVARIQLKKAPIHAPLKESRNDKLDQQYMDACWYLGHGIGPSNPLHSALLNAWHLRLAAGSSDGYRLSRGLAWETILAMAEGGKANRERAPLLVARGAHLAEHIDNSHARGWNMAANAYRYWCEGNYAQAIRYAEQAEDVYRNDCRGVTWELGSLIAWCTLPAMLRHGQLRGVRVLCGRAMREFASLGDRYTVTVLRTYVQPWLRLADDQPQLAMRDSAEVLEQWSDGPWQLQHFCHWIGDIRAYCYQGDGESALQIYRKHYRKYTKALQHKLQIKRMFVVALLAQAWILSGSSKTIKQCRRLATKLDKEQLSWGSAHAVAIRAAIARLSGNEQAAKNGYLQAAKQYAELGMSLYAAVARAQAGEQLALAELSDAGVRVPARYAQVLVPGQALELDPSEVNTRRISES